MLWRLSGVPAGALLLVTVVTSSPALAWNPFASASSAIGDSIRTGGRKLGQGLGEGAVEALQPALVSTIGTVETAAGTLIADVDTRLTRQVDHAGGVASRLVSETKGAVDTSLDKVDHILEKRLLQVEAAAGGLVRKLDSAVDRNLQTADRILKERSAHLGQIVSDSIGKADRALEARITQLDESVALRLGNVDVIASKQRLGLEETLVRTGVLVALLAFIVIMLRTVWREYLTMRARLDGKRGVQRTIAYLTGFAKPVLLQVVAASLAIGAIYALYDRLPLGARARAAELAAMHRREMNASLARFDFSRVRFHASQLEILVPDQGAYYQAMAGKAELLRDLVMRPALLATDHGVSQIVERVQALERRLGKRADPDVLTMKALVLWQVGSSKQDEHAAASYCARALRLSPGGFALAPLARHYIRSFMHAPYVAPESPYGRNAESLQDLRVLASAPMAKDWAFPLNPVIEMDRLIIRLDRELIPAYLAMLDAHADVVRGAPQDGRSRRRGPAAESAERQEARARRTELANRVLAAWDKFDQSLDTVPGLAGKSAVLAIFRLNDATRSRAAWFAFQPQTNDIAPLLAETTDLQLRTKLAPPRIGWEKRYGNLIVRELRDVVELQEASRFTAFEAQNRDFERAYVAHKAGIDGPDRDARRRAAAVAAAKLGLYVSDREQRRRVSVAMMLASPEDESDPETAKQLAEAMQWRGMRTL